MRLSGVAKGAGMTLAGLALAATAAMAAPGFVTQNINMRAGPGIDYPLVAQLPQGTQAEIFGCLPGWSWCDVGVQDLRGWVAGPGLQLVYDDQPEPLAGYGIAAGLPLIGFDVDRYWGRYYRGRPFYHDEDRFRGERFHGGPPGGFHGHDEGPGPGRGPGGEDDIRRPGFAHPVGPAAFPGRPPEPGRPFPQRGPEPGPRPEAGPRPGAAPFERPGPAQPARVQPNPVPRPAPQGAPAGAHPGPGRPPEAHGEHEPPPH